MGVCDNEPADGARNKSPDALVVPAILRHMETIHRETGQQLVAPDDTRTRALKHFTIYSAFASWESGSSKLFLLAEECKRALSELVLRLYGQTQ